MNPLDTVEAFPLSWPAAWKRTPYLARRPAPFHRRLQRSGPDGRNWKEKQRLTVGDAMDLLRGELRRLSATRVTVSSNLRLRNDGLPFAQQAKQLDDPGVAVYFTLKGAARVTASDFSSRPSRDIPPSRRPSATTGGRRSASASTNSLARTASSGVFVSGRSRPIRTRADRSMRWPA